MDVVKAVLQLGLPVLVLSWWVHSWMYRNNIADRYSTRQEIDKAANTYRKGSKKQNYIAGSGDFWASRWFKFGGGFYGLTALWTLIVFEAQELWWLLFHIPEVFSFITTNLISALVALMHNQINSFVAAFTWIVSWTGNFQLSWFFTPIIGFYIGMWLAKKFDLKNSMRLFRI